MPLSIQITDRATPHLTRVEADLSSPGAKHAAGASVMLLILNHLVQLDAERPNALGGRRTNFYAKAGKSTSYAVNDIGATVSISAIGIAQRLFGGEIKPVNGKYLTIPARAEAYGRRAREFDTLEVLFGKNGPYALAERGHTDMKWGYKKIKGQKKREKYRDIARSRTVAGGMIFYWLVKSVSQAPDPSVLPEESVILDFARTAVNDYIHSLIN